MFNVFICKVLNYLNVILTIYNSYTSVFLDDEIRNSLIIVTMTKPYPGMSIDSYTIRGIPFHIPQATFLCSCMHYCARNTVLINFISVKRLPVNGMTMLTYEFYHFYII